MAEECVSVRFENGEIWNYCWEDIEPSWEPEEVTTGLRKAYSPRSRPWRTCQYYMKGMPAVCKYWRKSTGNQGVAAGTWACHYRIDNEPTNPNDPAVEYPSGFNNYFCDNLGRRDWCTKYDPVGPDNLDEYMCVAPNPYLTGLGKRATGQEAPIRRGLTRAEITGYNEDEAEGVGKGQCDCYGMGRGAAGCARVGTASEDATFADIERSLSELPLACNYFRASDMGFGPYEPHPLKSTFKDDERTITTGAIEDAYELIDEPLSYRLPISFKLYNLRAQFQKCQWWDQDYGLSFVFDEDTGKITLPGDPFDANDKVIHCKCPDTASDPYRTRVTAVGRLEDVWAQKGGPVCNGARPECPCYSGKWFYLTKEKMQAGMPVTANQILELRFWSSDWESQKQYDEFFKQKPNDADPADPAIFTYTGWQHLDPTRAEKSRLLGKKLTLCQPAPLQYKEFVPELYITAEEITYAPPYVETGTTEEVQWHFPSLIRDPKFPELKPLTVVYPYYNDDVFDPGVCNQPSDPGHIKRHNTVVGDSISVVGHTVRSRTVYALNISMLDDIDSMFFNRDTTSVFKFKKNERDPIYSKLIDAVYNALQNQPQYISYDQSNSETGYFILSPLSIDYNRINIILICVDYGDGTWELRRREVSSIWYGGILRQSDYNHSYPDSDSGYTNQQPLVIAPAGTATLQAIPMGNASVGDIISVYSHEPATFFGTRYYGYSLVEYTVEEFTADVDPLTETSDLPWVAIGDSNLVWVQIEDTNLNYVHSWRVAGARMEPKTETDEDGNEVAIRKDAVEIEMEVVSVDQNSIPPNVCVLKPKGTDRVTFLHSEWQLYITYAYQKLVSGSVAEDDTTRIISGAGASGSDIYRAAPFSLTQSESEAQISNISTGPLAVMAYFKDEDDRPISTMATKACVNIVSERCRSVDIFYRYEADGRRFKLQPERGFCIDIKQDMPMSGLRKHVETPDCGDHDVSELKWEGPMWYPFNVCRGFDMYDEFTVCNNCQASYGGPFNDGMVRQSDGTPSFGPGGVILRRDFRYCGPYRFDAWGNTRGNWAASCDCGCSFYYSDADDAQVLFTGYARKRGPILLSIHLGDPPPYGNEGRELIEKFMSHDYIDHFLLGSALTQAEWMPMMMDNTDFFMTFNAFDTNVEDEKYIAAYALDPFYHVNQLNFLTLDNIGETIDYITRYRFDDIFDVQFEGNSSYPKPVMIVNNVLRVTFYYFKSQDISWAWQEAWVDVERNLSEDHEISEGKLDFVLEYEKPKYVYSINKEEHRLICDEGEHTIVYTGPTFDDDGNLDTLPTISLDGDHPRPFEILYSSYSSSQVTWKNEGGGAKVGGSSTKDEDEDDNLYEEAMGNDWLHDDDILFDSDAKKTTAEATAAGRRAATGIDDITSEEEYKYYNRGIIANIPRSRLDYLPKDETQHSFNGQGFEDLVDLDVTEPAYSEPYIWNTTSVTLETPNDENFTMARLVMKGVWGYESDIEDHPGPFVKPTVGVIIDGVDGYSGEPRGFSSGLQSVQIPEDGQKNLDYTIDFKFPLGPEEMITRRIKNLQIVLTGAEGHSIYVNSIELYSAEYAEERTETINVWERKYITSKFSVGNTKTNLDGPDNNLHYHPDLTNAGIYPRFKGGFYPTEEVSARDKMREAYCGIYHADDESIEVNYDNLHDIEAEEQKYLYEYAFNINEGGDSTSWSAEVPIKFQTFMEDTRVDFPIRTGAGFYSERLRWEDHTRTKDFRQYEYWRPGGHYYTWDPDFRREKCYIFGPAEDVFSGFYVHVDHLGRGTPISVDPSQPVDPGNSYYSLRFYTQQAKYNRFLILSGQEPIGFDLVSSASPYAPQSPVRVVFE